MTDKEQIIINGVDVSECENFKPKDRFTCHPYICNCHQKPNCYFKQFARKTQECKELKAEEKYLKQCCKKAGEELAKHSFDYDNKEKNLVIQAMELNEKYEKYKTALEEIKDLLFQVTNVDFPKDDYITPAYKEVQTYYRSLQKQILDIINKAKGGNNE